jgi:ParB/RepB/Spo0J family partition protein
MANRKRKKPKIREIDPRLIMPDPENVRHEDIEEIESDESFERLKESVYTYGVLVPLVVKTYNDPNKIFKYVLIDGERRLRAALATNVSKVAVHILNESEVDNQMLYAFQIHMLRKEWSRPSQARALLKIIKEVEKQNNIRSEKLLFPLLQEKTGYNQNKLQDLLRVIRYIKEDERLLDDMEDNKSNIKFSHFVQLEASFMEQLERNYPEIIKEYGRTTIRNRLTNKVKNKIIGSTREPINLLLPLFADTDDQMKRKYVAKLIKEFIDEPDKTAKEVYRAFELRFPTNKEDMIKMAKEVAETIEGLISLLRNMNVEQLCSYKNIRHSFEKQIAILESIIDQTKKRFRDTE